LVKRDVTVNLDTKKSIEWCESCIDKHRVALSKDSDRVSIAG